MSIRDSFNKGDILEKIADIIFLTGLGTLFITILLFSFNVIA